MNKRNIKYYVTGAYLFFFVSLSLIAWTAMYQDALGAIAWIWPALLSLPWSGFGAGICSTYLGPMMLSSILLGGVLNAFLLYWLSSFPDKKD